MAQTEEETTTERKVMDALSIERFMDTQLGKLKLCMDEYEANKNVERGWIKNSFVEGLIDMLKQMHLTFATKNKMIDETVRWALGNAKPPVEIVFRDKPKDFECQFAQRCKGFKFGNGGCSNYKANEKTFCDNRVLFYEKPPETKVMDTPRMTAIPQTVVPPQQPVQEISARKALTPAYKELLAGQLTRMLEHPNLDSKKRIWQIGKFTFKWKDKLFPDKDTLDFIEQDLGLISFRKRLKELEIKEEENLKKIEPENAPEKPLNSIQKPILDGENGD